ncbi:glutathione S-transferase family protein [Pseudomonas akapageensis]|uniref:glutathione S-transferase family protein n=1 Tax=Pseudomonas akapageensis TaxID=2609961 RepID=UPI00140737ED|nr:glutathione S-transferase family protein [Pseudomonas akapageensis]
MSLTLYSHPLSSFCHKVFIALYENDTPFTSHLVDFGDPDSTALLHRLWPMGKMPVLRDAARSETIPETSIIIEYLEQHYPGPVPLLPNDESLRLQTRLWDRFFDLHVQVPMQKIVGDRLRPENGKDVLGVADAHASLRKAYALLEQHMANRHWAIGDAFSLADCAAAPALFYGSIVEPFPAAYGHLNAYFERLLQRPSFKRVLNEARPWLAIFPFKEDVPARFLRDN